MNRNIFCFAILSAAVVMTSMPAAEEVINVDLGSTDGGSGAYVGTAVVPDTGTV